jgi:hypothetical protein
MTNRHAADLVVLAGCAAFVLVGVLSACGAPAHSGSAAATESTCEQVGAVLSDGPDPDADPVGYAEAQVIPLRQIHATDQALRGAIGQLADAYSEFYASDGKSRAAKQAVAAADAKINSVCPGAAS